MNYFRQLLFGLLLFANFAGLAKGQTNAATDFKLEGRILNAITGRPIPRALVQVTSGSQQPVLSGPEGEFSFSHVPQGTAYVMVSKPGFFPPGRANTNGGPQTLRVQVGPDTPSAEFKLMPEAVITGQVIGNDGEPIEGAIMELLSARTVRGVRQIVPVARRVFGFGAGGPRGIRTDEDGSYRIASLPPGSYYIAVKTGDAFRGSGTGTPFADSKKESGNLAYPPIVYSPGVTDFDSAMPVQVSGGQHVAVDFSLKQVPAYKVSGTVTGPREWQNVNPPVIIDETQQQLFSTDKFDSNTGAFEFKALPAGTYRIRLSGSDQNHTVLTAIRKLSIDGPAAGVRFSMGAAQDIPVIVRKQLSKPVKAMQCSITGPDGTTRTTDCSEFPPVAVQLRSSEGDSAGSTGFGHESDPNNLKLKGIMPGTYVVKVSPRNGGYVDSVRSGAQDLLREELVVPHDGSVAPIEVTLRDDTASVKLRVNDDAPGKSAWAVLLSDLMNRDPVIVPLNAGSVSDYGGVPPGDYQVFALDSMDGIDVGDPELLQKYASNAKHVTLTANGTTSVSLDVVKTGE